MSDTQETNQAYEYLIELKKEYGVPTQESTICWTTTTEIVDFSTMQLVLQELKEFFTERYGEERGGSINMVITGYQLVSKIS